MIDIHTHILPAVDDGSKSVENSIQMLKDLSANGVSDVVLTPHYRGKYNTPKEVLIQEFAKFKEVAKEVDINLYLGREIYCDRESLNLLSEGKLLTLNGTK